MSEERIAELEARVAELEKERDAALAARDSIMREVLPVGRLGASGEGSDPRRGRSTAMLLVTFVLIAIVALLVWRMANTAKMLGRRSRAATRAGSGSSARGNVSNASNTHAHRRASHAVSVFRAGRRAAIPMLGLSYVGPLALGPRSRLLVVGGAGGRAVIYDLGSDRLLRTLAGHAGAIRDVAFDDAGKHVLTAGADGKVILWALSGAKVRELRSKPFDGLSGVRDIAVGGEIVAMAAEGDGLELATLDGRLRKRVERSQPGWVRAVAVARGGKKVAAAGEDGKIRVYGVSVGKDVFYKASSEIEGHPQWVNALAFSAKGDLLASAGFEKRVMIWDVASGKRRARLRGHVRRCTALAFDPSATLLASASLDRTIVLWDVARATKPGKDDKVRRAVLRGHRYQVNSVAFDHRGRFAVSSSGDGTVRVWPVALPPAPSRRLLPRPAKGELTLRGYTSGERRRIRVIGDDGKVLPEGRRALAYVLRSGPDDASKLPAEKLVALLYKVVDHFGRWREVVVISGYRSPRFNTLRTRQSKQVAKKSRHMRGEAIDFQIEGVSLRKLHRYVKKLKAGGLGLYPDSQFIHMDVGPVRYWGGD
ncbi:MAG: DUF882 domain-containing protein [Myxococcales bacterium]|nr:DUF882 domain-containing protein [Myxococcales bacterium]